MVKNDELEIPPGCARSPCPVACLLDIVGDKWTLLVIRDLFREKQTFGELQDSLERIPTNILADRLKRLEQHGLVKRILYQERPRRYQYRLTNKGKDLKAVMMAMVKWSNKHVPGTARIDSSGQVIND